MIFIKYIFMVFIICFSIIRTFIKDPELEKKDLNPESILSISRYFSLGTFNFSLAWIIFHIDALLWLSLYSSIGMILSIKEKNQKNEGFAKIIGACILIIIFSIVRVPVHNDSFMEYINSKGKYQCLYKFECVKITSNINKDDQIQTKAEIVPISGYSFDWYLFFATGSIIIGKDENKEEINGVNIAGWWIVSDW
ncbi:hypothetical protein ACQKP0_10410 [Heyndrickxia sp. NPDC080065]|uniref:hypothetical protein n=1 Tax=Heyndrickxia sp. NPDC080065 TaxID=3390568 RepID=UPI003D01330A